MPTYEYRCKACGHEFEEFQSMTAPVLKKCPECGKNQLERLIGTGAALIFKGSGFYQTDYRTESYKKGAESDKPAGGEKSEGKSDAKKGEAASSEAASSEGRGGTSTKSEPKAADAKAGASVKVGGQGKSDAGAGARSGAGKSGKGGKKK